MTRARPTDAPTRGHVRVVSAYDQAAGLLTLLGHNSNGCFCRFWHFEDHDNDWLQRCAGSADENRRDKKEALLQRAESARGVVALMMMAPAIADDPQLEQVVGWLKLCRASDLPKLYGRRFYRDLGCFSGDRKRVAVASCMLIDPHFRRQGIAEALVRGAVEHARAAGFEAIEALPRRSSSPLRDEELWMGPPSTYERCGFEVIHDELEPYPVMRIGLKR
jgi:GNAT superfamily N-acetyltransferase